MHPMYRRLSPHEKLHLWQGDLIDSRKLEDEGALAGHQDYLAARTDLPAFCVLTQTCDLMPRRRVDYVTLAVVRHLKNLFSSADATGDRRNGTYSLLEKIINHRENKGFFYLHPLRNLIPEPGAVVDLRTSFALHRQHYDQILRSRRASLVEVFAHKLGWMTGHLFSRVPNLEWDDFRPQVKHKQFVQGFLEQIKNEKEQAHLEVPLYSFGSAVKHLTPQLIRQYKPERWAEMIEQIETLSRRLKRNKPTANKPTGQQPH